MESSAVVAFVSVLGVVVGICPVRTIVLKAVEMDELTPLTFKSTRSSGLNAATILAANKLKRGTISSKISFSLRERQRALREVGVGQAAHLCRDGEMRCQMIFTNHFSSLIKLSCSCVWLPGRSI